MLPVVWTCHGAMHVAPAGASLPAISKVLRTLKHTEDATAEPATESMHVLCDAALALARALVEHRAPGASQGLARYPGNVPLPRYMFRQLDARLLGGGAAPVSFVPPSRTLPSLFAADRPAWLPAHARPHSAGACGHPCYPCRPPSG